MKKTAPIIARPPRGAKKARPIRVQHGSKPIWILPPAEEEEAQPMKVRRERSTGHSGLSSASPTATEEEAKPIEERRDRSPGRPTAAAANADQRAHLLDAAIALFSEQGIAAAPLRAIAQRAGVTPALLHYYFKSKDSLVETILSERVAPFVAVSVAPLLTPLPSPRATLRKFLEGHMRNLAANPWMPRLMLREVLSDGGSLRAQVQAQFSAVISPKTLMLISAAQRKGEIRADLSPILIGVSLISLAVFPFAAAPLWRDVARSIVHDLPASVQKSMRLGVGALTSSAGYQIPGFDLLIEHTLTLFDSMLEKPRAKAKR